MTGTRRYIKRYTKEGHPALGVSSLSLPFALCMPSVCAMDEKDGCNQGRRSYPMPSCEVGDVADDLPMMGVGGGVAGDPKGAGVSTTSRRYSRESHRQTRHFPVVLFPQNSRYCLSISPNRRQKSQNTADSGISGVFLCFCETPGVLTTRESDIDHLIM